MVLKSDLHYSFIDGGPLEDSLGTERTGGLENGGWSTWRLEDGDRRMED